MLTIAMVALSVLVTFKQPLTTAQRFDIPAEEVGDSMYTFMRVTRAYDWAWLSEHGYIQTRAVHGVFTLCEALHQMLEGTSVEVFDARTMVPICAPPSLPPTKARPRRIARAPSIDPPAIRRCQCLEISGIPIPWCEDERKSLINAHECTEQTDRLSDDDHGH